METNDQIGPFACQRNTPNLKPLGHFSEAPKIKFLN